MCIRDRCFTLADNSEIPNEGEMTLPTFSPECVRTDQTWQVASVGKPLLSVGEECDKDQWVLFNKFGGMIFSLEKGAVRQFTRAPNGPYEMEMWIPPAQDESSGFTRQGI